MIRRVFAAFALLAYTPVASASAQRPVVRSQAPGFYRFMLGDFEVIALLDGTHGFPAAELAVNAKPGEVRTLLERQYLASPVEGMINAFLIKTPTKLVLIDTGAGNLYGKDGGLLVGNLRAAGYEPADIDEIYLTHLHRDHVGGLMMEGKAVFPKAIVRVSEADARYWLDDSNRSKAPAFLGTMFDGAEQVLEPYIADGRFRPFTDLGELTPGIRPILAPGHTPGHCYYAVESKGQTLIVWGDTVHVASVQFADPNVAIKYDSSTAQAIVSSESIFAEAAKKGWWIAGAHISFPGIGHVGMAAKRSYVWIPANYSLNR